MHHFRNTKGTGVETRFAMVYGIVTGDTPVTPIFSVSLSNYPKTFCDDHLRTIFFLSILSGEFHLYLSHGQ